MHCAILYCMDLIAATRAERWLVFRLPLGQSLGNIWAFFSSQNLDHIFWQNFRQYNTDIFNRWFLMYFSYLLNYAPPKPSKIDNYWIIMNFFGKYISKCTYRMKKRTPVSAYRSLSTLSNKPIVFISSRGSPCMIKIDIS